ncbi:MAG: DUF2202 domain-containing protein [Comamonadaceae bacterium]|nr:DUF2202 domain-containing protein [Comamonadaceae bacterium]
MSAGLLAAFLLTACGGGGDGGNGGDTAVGKGGPPLVVDADGVSTFDSTALGTSLAALPVETLSAAEQESLLFMREEEKLAHDVYAGLDAGWGASLRVFGNIARSESTHTEAVRRLLLRYALPDPTASLAAGVYQNTLLQGLYTQLMATGNGSLVDALKVGAAIEEIDMIDLNKALLAIDNRDIVLVYQNLLKGSRNHLRSFVSTLANRGVSYEPRYMTPTDYQAIISTPIER